MSNLSGFLRSSIGSKALMAVTGLLLFGFIVGHLAGNLSVFAGRDAMNSYAATLKSMPALLWTVRLGLLVIFVAHVATAIRLNAVNRAARPQAYACQATVQASFASRSMVLTGLVVLAYVIYHLLHFTVGVTDPEAAALTETVADVVRHDVYGMVVTSFQKSWLVVIAYVVANLLLALHLSHGIGSFLQTLGFHDARYNKMRDTGSILVAALIGAGYVSIPLAIRLGLVTA